MSVQPPAPPLTPEVEELVFTHKSLYGKPSNMVVDAEDPKDWERVSFLGEGVVYAAISNLLYTAFPRHRTSHLKVSLKYLLVYWSIVYSLSAAYQTAIPQQGVTRHHYGRIPMDGEHSMRREQPPKHCSITRQQSRLGGEFCRRRGFISWHGLCEEVG